MDLIYPDNGLVQSLLVLVENGGSGLLWSLYTNNYTPIKSSVLADFTSVSGDLVGTYKAVDFVFQQTVGNVGYIQANNKVKTNSSGASKNWYGYYVLHASTSKIIAAARFDDAPRVIANGGTTQIVPILGAKSVLP